MNVSAEERDMHAVNGISYNEFVRAWAKVPDDVIRREWGHMFADLPWPLGQIFADAARIRRELGIVFKQKKKAKDRRRDQQRGKGKRNRR